MFGVLTIVFREFLEIALVVSVVLAATQNLQGRLRLVGLGLGLGAVGTLLLALFTQQIAQTMNGIGQEIFNAGIMFSAVALLSWTVLWMKQYGGQMAQNIRDTSAAILAGAGSLYTISLIVALATLREGAEIVLFTYGMLASGAVSLWGVAIGGLAGALAGSALGAGLYYGLISVSQKYLLTITSWMLILLAAGMAMQGANFLISANVLPALSLPLWDSSAIIDGASFFGQILAVLVGYNPSPTLMELLFYIAIVLGVGLAYSTDQSPTQQKTPTPTPAE